MGGTPKEETFLLSFHQLENVFFRFSLCFLFPFLAIFSFNFLFCFGQLEACKVCDSEHISARKEDDCLLLRAPYSYFIRNCIQPAVDIDIVTILSSDYFVNNSLVSKNFARFLMTLQQATHQYTFFFTSDPIPILEFGYVPMPVLLTYLCAFILSSLSLLISCEVAINFSKFLYGISAFCPLG